MSSTFRGMPCSFITPCLEHRKLPKIARKNKVINVSHEKAITNKSTAMTHSSHERWWWRSDKIYRERWERCVRKRMRMQTQCVSSDHVPYLSILRVLFFVVWVVCAFALLRYLQVLAVDRIFVSANSGAPWVSHPQPMTLLLNGLVDPTSVPHGKIWQM